MTVDEARDHAVLASEMLASLTRLEKRLEEMSADDRLQMTATGGYTRVNRDMEWSAKIAIAHALTAIALALTEQRDDHFSKTSDGESAR